MVNKEISRKHAEIYVESGRIFLNSMGREPVSVNGTPVTSPVQLNNGDKIEIYLSGRTRIFYFHALRNAKYSRSPLKQKNIENSGATALLEKENKVLPGKPLRNLPLQADNNNNNEQSLGNKERTAENANKMEGSNQRHGIRENTEEPVLETDKAEVAMKPQEDFKHREDIESRRRNTSSLIAAPNTVKEEKNKVAESTSKIEGPPGEVTAIVSEMVEKAIQSAMLSPMKMDSKLPEAQEDVTMTVSELVRNAFLNALKDLQEGNALGDQDKQQLSPDQEEKKIASDQVHREEVTMIVSDLVQQAFHAALSSSENLERPTDSSKSSDKTEDVTSVVSDLIKQAFERVIFDECNDANKDAQIEKCGNIGRGNAEKMPQNSNDVRSVLENDENEGDEYANPESVTMTVNEMVKQAFASILKTPLTGSHKSRTNGSDNKDIENKKDPILIQSCTQNNNLHYTPKAERESNGLVKKNVRFSAMCSTPEGALEDATMTLRFQPSSSQQDAVLIGDDTINIARWALGAQSEEKEKSSSVVVGVEDDTAGKIVADTTVSPCLQEGTIDSKKEINGGQNSYSSAIYTKIAVTPAGPGTRAPATTPATEIQRNSVTEDGNDPGSDHCMDPKSLLSKLNELAKDHEITFELPADFMRWTPGPNKSTCASATRGTKTISLTMTPKRTMSTTSIVGEFSASKGARSGSKPSRLGYTGTAFENSDLNSSGKRKSESGIDAGIDEGARNVSESLAKALELVASAQKPMDSLDKTSTPVSKVEGKTKQRRCSMRTTGTKVAIIMSGTPGSKALSSVKKPLQNEMLHSQTSKEHVHVEVAKHGENDKDYNKVPVEEYRRIKLKYKSYRHQSVRLARRLHHISGHALRLQKSIKKMRGILQQEHSRRKELQKTLKSMVEMANEDEEMIETEENSMEVEECENCIQDESIARSMMEVPTEQRVVVVGYVEPIHKEFTERAGRVVVVRPRGIAKANTSTPFQKGSPNETEETPMTGPIPRQFSSGTLSRTPLLLVPPTERQQKPSTFRNATSARKSTRKALEDKRMSVEVPKWLLEDECDQKYDKEPPSLEQFSDEMDTIHNSAHSYIDMHGAKNIENQKYMEEEQAFKAAQLEADAVEAQAAEDEAEEQYLTNPEEANQSDLSSEDESEDVCHICHQSEEGEVLLLCDGCDNACHLQCCDPPLKRVPRGDWYCAPCKDVIAKKKAEDKKRKANAVEVQTKDEGEKEKKKARGTSSTKQKGGTKAPSTKTQKGAKRTRNVASTKDPLPEVKRQTRSKSKATGVSKESSPKKTAAGSQRPSRRTKK